MRIPTRKRPPGLRFNITPMIDIVFLLIIFFLVASHFVHSETAEAVELPEATQHDDRESPHRLVVTIPADRQYRVAGRELKIEEIDQLIAAAGEQADLSAFEVQIRADRAVPYKIIEPILLSCARAGVTNVKFKILLK